jgi:hypothetical protein
MTTLSRRAFFATTGVAVAIPASGSARAMVQDAEGGLPPTYPSQEPDVVRAVVGKAHVDYEAVRELVTPRPELAKAAWDWGFGDWETALGAASHMGRHDIAELLIEHGARPDLFTFAMLDQVDVVRAFCEANPGIQRMHGPHGITLLAHARFGKAERVNEYLQQLGDADVGATNEPIDETTGATFVGDYVPADAPDTVLLIRWHERRGIVTFQRDDRQMRFLNYLGDAAFSPGGARSVRLEFNTAAGTLTIRDGDLRITARRR